MSSWRRWRSAVSALKRAIDSSQVETCERPSNCARGAPDVEENLADEVFRHGGVAHDAQDEAIDPHIVPAIQDVHRGAAAFGNAFEQHLVRGRLGGDDALAGCGVDGNDVLHDRLPVIAAWRRLVGKLIVTERFWTSAPKAENGFVARRIVSSRRWRRNNRGENASDFNDRKIAGGRVRRYWNDSRPGASVTPARRSRPCRRSAKTGSRRP